MRVRDVFSSMRADLMVGQTMPREIGDIDGSSLMAPWRLFIFASSLLSLGSGDLYALNIPNGIHSDRGVICLVPR